MLKKSSLPPLFKSLYLNSSKCVRLLLQSRFVAQASSLSRIFCPTLAANMTIPRLSYINSLQDNQDYHKGTGHNQDYYKGTGQGNKRPHQDTNKGNMDSIRNKAGSKIFFPSGMDPLLCQFHGHTYSLS